MVNIVANLIKLQEQIRILHWQTKIFSRHKAYSKAYDELGVLIDELVEVYQGKNNRLEFKQLTIDVTDIDVCKITDILPSLPRLRARGRTAAAATQAPS
jgi:hypothetical protein